MRKRMVGTAALALGAWCLSGQWTARAAGDLQGQELRPARELETGLETLLGGLIGGKHAGPAGRIESAVVAEDMADRLTITVSVSEGLDGRRLRGVLLDRNRRVQRQVRPAQSRLEDGAREAALGFELGTAVSDDQPLESAYVRISVDGANVQRLFTLGKTWGQGSSAGGAVGVAVVHVQAVPEGRAVALPAAEPTPTPLPTGPSGPPTRPPVVSGGQGGVQVYDTPGGRRRPEVRDHRGETRPEVRDHRGDGSGRPTRAYRPTASWMAAPAVAPSAGQQQAVLNQTAVAWRSLPQTRAVTLDPSAFTLTTADRGRGALGPDTNNSVPLLEDVDPDQLGLEADQVTRFNTLVFPDQNPASGLFYFLPLAYHLDWVADQDRYSLNVTYLAATSADGQGKVIMAAGLTSGVDSSEEALARKLLQERCRRSACGTTDPQLRPYPIDPEHSVVSLVDALRIFDIKPEQVASAGYTTSLSDINMAWTTDSVNKENLQVVLERDGLNGAVKFAAPGANQTSQPVGLELRLADPGSFGFSRWTRGQAWKNPTPFPVRVKYLHALMLDPQGRPTVYTWSLGGKLLAPGGRLECDAARVPAWVDAKALRLWIGYGVQADCTSCTERVVRAITGGVTSVAAAQITFSTITPLADTGAFRLRMRVRSRRFDAEGRASAEKTIVLDSDKHDFTLGPIYAGDASGSGEPLFEYFLTVVMSDGEEYEAARWVPRRDLNVTIGSSQVKQALGFLPGKEPSGSASPVPQP